MMDFECYAWLAWLAWLAEGNSGHLTACQLEICPWFFCIFIFFILFIYFVIFYFIFCEFTSMVSDILQDSNIRSARWKWK